MPETNTPPFEIRIQAKTIPDLQKSISERTNLLKSGDTRYNPHELEQGIQTLESRLLTLQQLESITDLEVIRFSIEQKKRQIPELEQSPWGDLQKKGIEYELSALERAKKTIKLRLFEERIRNKTFLQLQNAISIREKLLKKNKNSSNIDELERLSNELVILRKRQQEYPEAHTSIEQEIKTIRSQPLQLESLQLPQIPDEETILNSESHIELGHYFIATNLNTKTNSPDVFYAFDKQRNKVVIAKRTSKRVLASYKNENKIQDTTALPDTQINEKTHHVSLGTALGSVENDTDVYRFYEPAGIDLETYLKTHTIPPKQALQIMIEIVDGLRQLHSIDTVHLDVSPSNILIQEHATLIDFDDISIRNSITGKFHRGRPRGFRWMKPPELFEVDGIASPSSDTYESSILLYRMITGTYPFSIPENMPREDWTSYLHEAHKKGLFTCPDTVPPIIKQILEKGIQPDPTKRYQNSFDMLIDLLEAYKTLESEEKYLIPILEQPQFSKEAIPSATLVQKPDAILQPNLERSEYLSHQHPDYIRQLNDLNMQIPEKMNPNTKIVVCIPVAGVLEMKNIYATVASFSNQTIPTEEFEILLFLNCPKRFAESKKQEFDITLQEIQRAQHDFPHIKVHPIRAIIPDDQMRIGNFRKIVTDLSLIRQEQANITQDILLVSNDADNQGIDPNYLQAYVEYFQENPHLDAAVGKLSYDPKAWVRFPALQARQEFIALLDQVGFRRGNADLFGGNSVMKSSIYCGIGGYPPDMRTGEQEWTGNTIRTLRKSKKYLGFAEKALLVSSSRRGLMSYISGERVIFGDEKREEKMRSMDIESMPLFDHTDHEAVSSLQKTMERLINQIINSYDRSEKIGKTAHYYRNNLEKIGITYEVIGDPKLQDSTIRITNMNSFLQRNLHMQKMILLGENNMAIVVNKTNN